MARNGIRPIAQKRNWDCGIASLAMLLGLSYGDVSFAARERYPYRIPPSKRGLEATHMQAIALRLGRPLRRVYKGKAYLQDHPTGIVGLNGGDMSWCGHWAVWKSGTIIDPDPPMEVWALEDYLKRHKCRTGMLLIEE